MIRMSIVVETLIAFNPIRICWMRNNGLDFFYYFGAHFILRFVFCFVSTFLGMESTIDSITQWLPNEIATEEA